MGGFFICCCVKIFSNYVTVSAQFVDFPQNMWYSARMHPYDPHDLSQQMNDLYNIIEASKLLEEERREMVTMTKPDFQAIANLFKNMQHVPKEYRQQMALGFIHFFQSKNPNFDEVKFMKACGLN